MTWTVFILNLFIIVVVAKAQETRIVGGADATPNEFPHQCSLQVNLENFIKWRHYCAGSIIKSKWVLTAAHCTAVFSPKMVQVVAGAHNISADESTTQTRKVAAFIEHEKYQPDSTGIGPNDIALVKLDKPFNFNEFIHPVQLPFTFFTFQRAWLSGWGSTSRTQVANQPDILQKALLPLIPLKICKQLNADETITNKQLCTGPLNGSKGACVGDSGGALIQYFLNIPIQIGLVSWGRVPCAGINQTTTYTRVMSYIVWIKRKIA